MQHPVIVIAGPTATGKSDISIDIAKRIDAEIVVADSMQVYRGMDIGTAKVPLQDREVPHHCIDIADPGEPFSSAMYQEAARRSFSDIDESGKAALLSGGTGFYIRSAIDDYRFPKGEQKDNPLREELSDFLEKRGSEALWKMLNEKDPESAADIHPNNSKRVMRALEMHMNGESYHRQLLNLKDIPQLYESIFICIDFDRDALIERIESRVDRMREDGLVREVEGLLDSGLRDALTASSAIGYKEIVSALDGDCSIDEAFGQIKTATRRYAKRQRSWFRSDRRYIHVDATGKTSDQVSDEVMGIVSRASEDI